MKLILFALLATLPFILADDNAEQDGCWFTDGNFYYDISPLQKPEGDAWIAKDVHGNAYFFNFCGTLNNLIEGKTGCDPQSGACVENIYGAYFNLGRPNSDWRRMNDSLNQITNTYTGGDTCRKTEDGLQLFTTTFLLTCAYNETLTVTNVTIEDHCNVVIEAMSFAACGVPQFTYHQSSLSPIAVFFMSFFCTCSVCLCCAGCCYKSKRAALLRSRKCNRGYKAVATEAPKETRATQTQQQQQIPLQTVSIQNGATPYMYPMPYFYAPYSASAQVPLAYYPPMMQMPTNPYFFPQNVNVPSQENQTVPPLVQLETIDSQVDEDEKLARQLQAQFDRE